MIVMDVGLVDEMKIEIAMDVELAGGMKSVIEIAMDVELADGMKNVIVIVMDGVITEGVMVRQGEIKVMIEGRPNGLTLVLVIAEVLQGNRVTRITGMVVESAILIAGMKMTGIIEADRETGSHLPAMTTIGISERVDPILVAERTTIQDVIARLQAAVARQQIRNHVVAPPRRGVARGMKMIWNGRVILNWIVHPVPQSHDRKVRVSQIVIDRANHPLHNLRKLKILMPLRSRNLELIRQKRQTNKGMANRTNQNPVRPKLTNRDLDQRKLASPNPVRTKPTIRDLDRRKLANRNLDRKRLTTYHLRQQELMNPKGNRLLNRNLNPRLKLPQRNRPRMRNRNQQRIQI
jgi:hypothetical protein